MASTTLVTFLLTPPPCYSVHLFGSWDNFTMAYPMEKDQQKGHGHWTGCHTFTNIICDGEPSHKARGRDGGLKMGGTYWYYYKLNGETEYYDPKLHSTTTCPLLPGQTVNILEVPTETSTSSNVDCSSDGAFPSQTLNPKDRYAKLKAPLKRKRPASGLRATSSSGPNQSKPDQWMVKSIEKLKEVASEALIRVSEGFEKPVMPQLSRRFSLGRRLESESGTQNEFVPELNRTRVQSRIGSRPRTRHDSPPTEREPLKSSVKPSLQEALDTTPSSRDSERHNHADQQHENFPERVSFTKSRALAYSLLPRRPGKKHSLKDAPMEDTSSHSRQPQSSASRPGQSCYTISHGTDDSISQSYSVLDTPPQLSGQYSPDASPISILTPSPHRRLAEPRMLSFMDHRDEVNEHVRPIRELTNPTTPSHGSASAYSKLDSPIVISQEYFDKRALRGSSRQGAFQFPDGSTTLGEQNALGSADDHDIASNFIAMEKHWNTFSFTSQQRDDHAVPLSVNSGLGIHTGAKDDLLQDLEYLGAFIV